jgi:hypothetical protein
MRLSLRRKRRLQFLPIGDAVPVAIARGGQAAGGKFADEGRAMLMALVVEFGEQQIRFRLKAERLLA